MKFGRLCLAFAMAIMPTCALANAALYHRDWGCSAAVFIMPGMTDRRKALLLTNGHCINIGGAKWPGGGTHLRSDEILVNHEIGERDPYYALIYHSFAKTPNLYRANKIVFASISIMDVAVLELNVTYSEIKRLGFTVRHLTKHLPVNYTILQFTSHYRFQSIDCVVDRIAPLVEEAGYRLRNILKMKPGRICRALPGSSGTAGIPEGSAIIAAILNTESVGIGGKCELDEPCEKDQRTGEIITGPQPQAYAIPTAPLYNCYDLKLAKFDLNRRGCVLRQELAR